MRQISNGSRPPLEDPASPSLDDDTPLVEDGEMLVVAEPASLVTDGPLSIVVDDEAAPSLDGNAEVDESASSGSDSLLEHARRNRRTKPSLVRHIIEPRELATHNDHGRRTRIFVGNNGEARRCDYSTDGTAMPNTPRHISSSVSSPRTTSTGASRP